MDIKVPELGESVTEGTVAKWIVRVGDRVNQGDMIAEIETDKVNLEIVAEGSGVVQELLRQEGDTVRIGEVIAVLGEAGDFKEAGNAGEASSVPATAAASNAGTVKSDPISRSTSSETKEQPRNNERPQPAQAAAEAAGESGLGSASEVPASPAARKYAREHGYDLRQLASRDPLGRINAAAAKAISSPSAGVQSSDSLRPSPPESNEPTPLTKAPEKPVEKIRMSRRRQTIASRLVEVQHTAAMLTTFNEVDMSAVGEVRSRRKQAFYEKHGVKLGYMSFFTKAVVGALKMFPLLNAEIRDNEIWVKKYYDIGIAVSTDDGLVVPVVRDADRLSFAELEREIAALAEKARGNRLKIADLQGGTFTITNGGVFGSLMSTPILNPPQVGILGMHKIQLRPVAIDEVRMENRPMMYVAVSYDHRIVDGKEAVGFLVRVKELLEDPESLMFDV